MAAARSQHFVEWSQVAAFRLRRHHLAGKNQAGLAEVTRDVCGVQAQVMSAAEIALWTRNHDLAAAAIQSALWKDRTLVKTSVTGKIFRKAWGILFEPRPGALRGQTHDNSCFPAWGRGGTGRDL